MEEKKSPVKKVLSIIFNIILWLFVAFSVLMTVMAFAAQNSSVPTIFGKGILTVQTDSMWPVFEAGDIIIGDELTREESKNLQIGDIITFDAGDLDGDGTRNFNSHRIIEVEFVEGTDGPKYKTKGDYNTYNDEASVNWDVVKFKYSGTRIKGLGKALTFLQQPKGFLVCIVLPLIVFFFFELFMFVKKFLEIKGMGKKQISAADEELIKKQAIEEYLRQQKEAVEGKAEEVKAAAEEAAEKISDAVEDKAD